MKNRKFLSKISNFIVSFRYLFLCLFTILIIVCSINLNNVKVNYDIFNYLPDKSETKYGLKIMEKEFKNSTEIQLLIKNIEYDDTLNKIESINKINHVKNISFDNTYNHYKDNNALIVIEIDKVNSIKLNNIKKNIIKIVNDKENYLYIENNNNISVNSAFIFAIIIGIIIVILLIITHSYFDCIIATIIILISILINVGSNFLLGEISYISIEIVIVLQLVLSLNYLIIFLNHYNKEIDDSKNKILAIKKTVSKSIPQIFVSSLTIFSGLIALFFMQLKIGNDIGIVMFKGIICTLLTVILLLPCLLILFNKIILKLRHRSIIPNIARLSKIIISSRRIILPLFLVFVIISICLIPKYDYIYNDYLFKSRTTSENYLALNEIKKTFGYNNRLVIIVKNPDKDYPKEYMIAQKLLQDKKIISVNNIGNTKIDQKIYLGSSINYQEFSQIFNLDLQTSSKLYQLYATNNDELIKLNDIDNYHIPIINWIYFLYDKQLELSLNDEIKLKINNYYENINSQINLFESNNYSKFIIDYKGELESEDTFKLLDIIKDDVSKTYDEVTLVGDSVIAREFKTIFKNDNLIITFATILFIVILLIIIFKSIGITLLIIITIEGCVLINFGLITLIYNKIYFISYVIVSAIQIGITLDYAVSISNKYQKSRIKMNKKKSLIEALKNTIPRIITNGLILTIIGFIIGYKLDSEIVSETVLYLGIGVLISIICIAFIFPALIYSFDNFIHLTTFKKKIKNN